MIQIARGDASSTAADGQPMRYSPPNVGLLKLVIIDGFIHKPSYRVMTQSDQSNIADLGMKMLSFRLFLTQVVVFSTFDPSISFIHPLIQPSFMHLSSAHCSIYLSIYIYIIPSIYIYLPIYMYLSFYLSINSSNDLFIYPSHPPSHLSLHVSIIMTSEAIWRFPNNDDLRYPELQDEIHRGMTFLSIHPSLSSIHPSLSSIPLIHPFIHLFIHLFIHSFIHPFIHPSIQFIHPSIYLSIQFISLCF